MDTVINATLTNDAAKAVRPTIIEMIGEIVAQGLEKASAFTLTTTPGKVEIITSMNSDVLFEKDANGVVKVDPVTSQPIPREFNAATMTIGRQESGKAA